MSIQEIIKKKLVADNNVKRFNVFTTLREISDEVYLHSRFISSILDPEGEHGLGKLPLEKFLKEIGSSFTCGNEPTIRPNPRVELWKEEQEIDILIEGLVNGNAELCSIIVENKIYANDSNHPEKGKGQLQGYYHYLQTEKENVKYTDDQIEVYYLTPNRHEPSTYSLKGDGVKYPQLLIEKVRNSKHPRNKYVRLIDYPREIKNWISQVAKVASDENLQNALEQYNQVIIKLAKDIKLNEELTNIVSEHFEEVRKIGIDNLGLGEKVKDVKWHVIVDFLSELDNALRQNDLIIQDRIEPMHLAVTDLIHHPTKHTPIYYRIERANIVWTLEANDRCHEKGFFLGIDNAGNGWKEIIHLLEIDSKLPRLNLWDFTDGDTISLLDKSSHVAIAKTYADCVKEYLLQYELS